jgi:hypothetical protein
MFSDLLFPSTSGSEISSPEEEVETILDFSPDGKSVRGLNGIHVLKD